MNKSTRSKLLADLKTLPGFVLTEKYETQFFGKCRGYYFNAYEQGDEIIIRFAVAKNFDRWANSTNFECQRSYKPEVYRANLLQQYRWMNKVVRSKIFNWNSYFHTIELPYVGMTKD